MRAGNLSVAMLIVLYINFQAITAQDRVQIKRLNANIEFDGMPFEEAWEGLDFFPLTMQQPDFKAEPSEKSEVMMTYDDEYVWVGARLYMQDATKIVTNSKKRDELLLYSDSFAVFFDTYNDNENGLVFYTMPSGLRTDYSVSNDAARNPASGSSFNFSWNTFWDVKTSIDEKGWYVEMRIPFSSLRFKSQNDMTTMGLILRRVMSYNHETDTYPSIDPKYETSIKPSIAATIQFEGVKPSKPVYVSPYVIGGFSRDWRMNTEETRYINDDTPDFNAGLDIKYNINNNLTLDLTTNTDFAQVEADDQQVNLTRYSLYFPEKRMFFQERSSLFNYSLGGRSNLFYSRNIGLSEGEPVRIYGGARLVGRIGKWDMGLLDMQTEKHGETPGENFGVFRMRRQVINAYSYVGGIFTSRIGMNGAHNFAYGLDGIFRLFGDDYLNIKVAQSYDDKIDNKIVSIDPLFFSANWEKRSVRGFAYNLGYSYSGQKFKPGIGFVNMGSLQGITGNVLYGWLPGYESRIFNIIANVSVSRYTRLEDGKLESMAVTPGFSIETKKGYQSSISLDFQQEGVLRDFPITDSVWVAAGNYSFTGAQLSMSTPSSKAFSVALNTNAGDFYDGHRYGVSFSPEYNVSPSLQISASYQYNHVHFPDRKKEADIHIISGRLTYMLNTKLSASIYIQHVNTRNELISNFRIRYNPREGNDFYLVFNDYRSTSREEFIPALPNYYNRTILLKYTHTLIF